MTTRLIVCTAAAVLLSAARLAAPADFESKLKACAGLRNPAERLACYDRTTAQLDEDSDSADTAGVAPEAMFGMSERLGRRHSDGAPDREEISSISAQVKALREAADGTLLIELDNGQIWQQLDSRPLMLEVGARVTISRGALSSFRIATAGNRFGRVRRVQ